MRLSCAAFRKSVDPSILQRLDDLGVQPIVTPQLLRVVYEGPDRKLAEEIVALFEQQPEHEVYVDYDKGDMTAKEKHAMRQKGR